MVNNKLKKAAKAVAARPKKPAIQIELIVTGEMRKDSVMAKFQRQLADLVQTTNAVDVKVLHLQHLRGNSYDCIESLVQLTLPPAPLLTSAV